MSAWRTLLALPLLLLPQAAGAQTGRDYVSLVAPPSLRPYVETALADFGDETRFKYPELRVTNTPASLRLLCAGAGIEYPDIAFLWQPVSPERLQACEETVGLGLVQVLIGYEAISAVRLKSGAADGELALSSLELFSAMADMVPAPAGQADAARTLAANQFRRWSDINRDLPDRELYIVTPPKSHPDAGILLSTVLAAGCRQIEAIAVFEESDPAHFQTLCETFRTDGRLEEFNASRNDLTDRLRLIEAGFGGIETLGDEMLYQATAAAGVPPLAIGFMRVHELAAHPELQPIALEGAMPNLIPIRNGVYPAARPIHLLLKTQSFAIVPGLRDFIAALISDRAIGQGGYLAEIGLVPLSKEGIGRITNAIFDAIRRAAAGRTASAGDPAEPVATSN